MTCIQKTNLISFLKLPVLNSQGLKYWATEILSEMVTMWTRNLGMCQLGKPHWSVGQQPKNDRTRMWFLTNQWSPRSNAFRFVPRTPGCWHSWVQVFPVPLEKSRECRWVSCRPTCSFFWQLQSQRHWHWWWHSAIDKRSSECRQHVTSQVALRPEFHGSNVKPSGRLPSSRTSPSGFFMPVPNAGSSQSAPDDVIYLVVA